MPKKKRVVPLLLQRKRLNALRAAVAPWVHLSCCAVHNAPALPPGPCNCGAVEQKLEEWSVFLLGPKKAELIGFVEAATESEAGMAAGEKFANLGEWKVKRLCVRRRRCA